MKKKEFDKALTYYNKSIEKNSEDPTTYFDRALTFIKLKGKFLNEIFTYIIKYESIKFNINIYRLRKCFKGL
jgi:hypothetical protein